MNLYHLWLFLVSVSIQYTFVHSWDNEELEIFDLVEEIGVGNSFYKILGVEQVFISLVLSQLFLHITSYLDCNFIRNQTCI